MKNKRCIIWVRVSTDEQVKSGHSLKDQEERLKKYAKEEGLIVSKTFIAEGETATDHSRRPVFNEMLKVEWAKYVMSN